MAALHNRVSQKELKARLLADTTPRTTLSFYRYFQIADPQSFRDFLYAEMARLQVYGRIYLAREGINAQVSVPSALFEAFRTFLDSIASLENLRLNIAHHDNGKSFWVLKIKVRDKIVADGISDPDFQLDKKGKYLDAAAFNALASQSGTVIVDMRNHYEFEVGRFESAIEIPSDTFREQLPMAVDMLKDNKDQPVIMYCTGGIRCEKASAYLHHHGFSQVFHLEGGIIHYANTVKEQGLENKFHGKNFVFDDRLGERITDEVIAHCHLCIKAADTHTNCRNTACHRLFIQCGECALQYDGCCSAECRQVLMLPEAEQQFLRKGKQDAAKFFNKSRSRRPAPVDQRNTANAAVTDE